MNNISLLIISNIHRKNKRKGRDIEFSVNITVYYLYNYIVEEVKIEKQIARMLGIKLNCQNIIKVCSRENGKIHENSYL